MPRTLAMLSLAIALAACDGGGNGDDAGEACAGMRSCVVPSVTCVSHAGCGSGYSCYIKQGETVGVCYYAHAACSDTEPCGGSQICTCLD